MFNKYKTLSMFNKSMVFTIIYSLIALIIGLVLLCLNTSWLYGVLMGLTLVFLTTLTNYFIYKMPSKGVMSAVGMPNLALIIRLIIYFVMFLLTIFVINPAILNWEPNTFDQKVLFNPINSLIMIFMLPIPGYAYTTVCAIDLFKKKPY